MILITQFETEKEKVKEIYEDYKKKVLELEECEKEIKDFESKDMNHYLVFSLDSLKREARQKNLKVEMLNNAKKFFRCNPKVEKYYHNLNKKNELNNQIKKLFNFYDNGWGQYVLLNQDNKKLILDLNDCLKLDVTDYDKDYLDFVKKAIDKDMLEITPEDLPFLMAIKEDIDYVPATLDKNDPYYIVGSEYLIRCDVALQLKLEFIRAKMTDNKIEEQDNIVNNMPFVLDADKQIRMMDDLVKSEKILSQDDYWISYYKTQMMFGKNVEQIYLEAPADKKGYVIDAYFNCSVIADYDEKFKTASPIVNTELLKRKYMTQDR